MVVSESLSIAASESNTEGAASIGRPVNITGRGRDVSFIIDEDASIDKVAGELGKQLSEGQGAFFSEGGVSVNTGRRNLTAGEKTAIRRVFEENSGLKISRFVSTFGDHIPETKEHQEEAPQPYPWRNTLRRPSGRAGDLDRVLTRLAGGSQRNRSQALLIRSTFRSGESIHHYGDVVVLGDVNPGSEIKADGDIIVMGALKGLPHAGASGDDKAAIVALEITSPRVRIGNCESEISLTDKTRRAKKRGRAAATGQPRIVYTRRGEIYISPFAGRFARYTKGVLYDR